MQNPEKDCVDNEIIIRYFSLFKGKLQMAFFTTEFSFPTATTTTICLITPISEGFDHVVVVAFLELKNSVLPLLLMSFFAETVF